MRLDAADLHAYVVLRDTEHRGHFLVAEPVKQQQRQGTVDLVQLPDLRIEPFDPRVRRRRGVENRRLNSIPRLLAIAVFPLLPRPRDCRVQGYAIN